MEHEVIARRRQRSLEGQNLAQRCSVLFLYLTSFRRNSASSNQGLQEVRDRIKGILEELRSGCAGDERLAALLKQVWVGLVVSIDQVMASSQWSQRAAWAEATLEGELLPGEKGAERFTAAVEEHLGRPGEDAAEIAEVLFECMALGYQGQLQGDKQSYEKKRFELYEKARVRAQLGDVLTPDAYGRNSGRSALKMPNVPLSRIIMVALCTILAFVAIGYFVTDIRSAATSAAVDGLRAKVGQSVGDV